VRKIGYILWALTLIVVAWGIAAVSAFLAGKGKIWVHLDAEAGVIDQ
jgi:hypothetical protein